jgi:hypothetical protein
MKKYNEIKEIATAKYLQKKGCIDIVEFYNIMARNGICLTKNTKDKIKKMAKENPERARKAIVKELKKHIKKTKICKVKTFIDLTRQGYMIEHIRDSLNVVVYDKNERKKQRFMLPYCVFGNEYKVVKKKKINGKKFYKLLGRLGTWVPEDLVIIK